jgi:hypothetical protein
MAQQTDRFQIPAGGPVVNVFTLTQTPVTGSIEVYRNGLLLFPTVDYTIGAGTVTITFTAVRDNIQIIYQTASAAGAGGGTLAAQDILYQALRKLGHLRAGYGAGPELLADGLTEWALVFDEWNNDRLMQYSQPDLTYTVTGPGSQSGGNGYTIGPAGADITGARPTSIIRANLVLNPGSSNPVYIPMMPLSLEQWAAKGVRKIPATNVATEFYYDPQFPNGVLNVFPPVTAGTVFELFQFGALVAPGSLATTYAGPPGYVNALVLTLAARLYYMVPKQLMPEKVPYGQIAGQAKAACDRIRKLNRPVNRLGNDFQGGGPASGFYDSFVTYTGEPY